MFDLPGPLGTFANFLVIAFGFGFIVFVHELGHFVAAKWAGIRVLAFSIGFGNVLVSYRKGIGFRRGSSDREYQRIMSGAKVDESSAISTTEYRLSMLPLGGYVKMLGQEDLNPEATSESPDSYQNCPVGKRMVVISAGVIMNVITAALLFIVVFMAGLKVFPAQIGFVAEGSPAAKAQAISHPQLEPGLLRGDRIIEVNGNTMHSFEAILPEIAMGSKSSPAKILIERQGVDGIIEFSAQPIKSEFSGLLDIGINPSISPMLKRVTNDKDQGLFDMAACTYGMPELAPGDVFLSANGQPIDSPFDLLDIAKESEGLPIVAKIDRNGQTIEHTFQSVRELQTDFVQTGDEYQGVRHILGLSGVMMVDPNASESDTQQGLKPGDIFARIGSVEFPSVPTGIETVRAHSGESLNVVVLRESAGRDFERVKLTVQVKPNGTIGFFPSVTTMHTNLVTSSLSFVRADEDQDLESDDPAANLKAVTFPASNLIQRPGSRVLRVGEISIQTLRDVQQAVLQATHTEYNAGAESFDVPVIIELPLPIQADGSIPTTTSKLTLTRADVDEISELEWTLPGGIETVNLFQYAQIIDKADGPLDAISRGISESRRVMLQTYITFLRLFEGSVQVKHLKGPVGIAHIGTQIASQGWVWVLFFMALISINLAVVNFLPLPIVDGGQFLMLMYEWIRGKPVPIVVQNLATMAGLLLIGTIFLYVTFNDVKGIFGL